MKSVIIFLAAFFGISSGALSQQIPFPYAVNIKSVTLEGMPGLHSYAFAQSGGRWLLIGGRTDGLHARQPFAAFPSSNNNTNIYVVDVAQQQVWSASVNTLAVSLKEQLQSGNMNFYQDDDTLYLIGGYAYSNSAQDHITFPNLTSVNVSGLINAVVNGQTIDAYFKQITHQNFAVNGGHLAKIGKTFMIVGGHRFDGRYNPMGNPTYSQTYTDAIKSFMLKSQGQLSFSSHTVVTDQVHLHRRDYNLLPQIFPNGEEGYTIFSGVFQNGINLPFLYPVNITATGYTAVTTFNQYLSNYHSATVALFDSVNNTMHSLFFGGISQNYFSGSQLVQDNNVPFVKTISRVSRNASGLLEETAFTTEMPGFLGASAEFIPSHNVPHYPSEIIKLAQLNGDSVLLGHIVGGISSPLLNPFTGNNTGVTSANSTLYEVWLKRTEVPTGIKTVSGYNPLKMSMYPNPGGSTIGIRAHIPYEGSLLLLVTDMNGKIVLRKHLGRLEPGLQTIDLSQYVQLSPGSYMFNFVFDGKFSFSEKMILD